MDIRTIASASSSGPRIDELIGLIGTPAFVSGLFSEMRRVSGCVHLAVVRYRDHRPFEAPLTANAARTPDAQETSRKYLGCFWRDDPSNAVIAAGGSRDVWIRTGHKDIQSKRYRQECYDAHGLIDRCSILRVRGARTLRLNAYRDAGSGPFSDTCLSALTAEASTLFALLEKHCATAEADPCPLRLRQNLSKLAPDLSSRDLDVCLGIINGQTSEGIALSLGVSVNTVLTYRKRVYTRLHISSQNELIRLAMACAVNRRPVRMKIDGEK